MKKRWTVGFEMVLLAALIVWIVYSMSGRLPDNMVEVRVRLRGTQERAYLVDRDGKLEYDIYRRNGTPATMTPDELAQRTLADAKSATWWMKVLNVTGPFEVIWVAVGLMGQVLFTGRMIVQWLASEKSHRSVVPPMFWWMSLVGATMLVMYFIWRRDPVGILGQAVGWFVYVRNLWMIYNPKPEAVEV